MLISVGVHEGIQISSESGINEKGSRVIVLQSKASEDDLLDAMLAGKKFEPLKSSFIQFAPNMLKFGTDEPKSGFELAIALNDEYIKLAVYGRLFATEDECVKAFGMSKVYQTLGLNTSDRSTLKAFVATLDNEETLKGALDIMYEAFHQFLLTKDLDKVSLRHKFWRGSKKKTFAAIPTHKETNPAFELDSIPVDQSNISWSVWEIEKGKNDATEMAADESEDTADAAEVFDAPIAAPIDPALLAETEPATDGTFDAPKGLTDAPEVAEVDSDAPAIEEAQVVEEMPPAPVMAAPVVTNTKEA